MAMHGPRQVAQNSTTYTLPGSNALTASPCSHSVAFRAAGTRSANPQGDLRLRPGRGSRTLPGRDLGLVLIFRGVAASTEKGQGPSRCRMRSSGPAN